MCDTSRPSDTRVECFRERSGEDIEGSTDREHDKHEDEPDIIGGEKYLPSSYLREPEVLLKGEHKKEEDHPKSKCMTMHASENSIIDSLHTPSQLTEVESRE